MLSHSTNDLLQDRNWPTYTLEKKKNGHKKCFRTTRHRLQLPSMQLPFSIRIRIKSVLHSYNLAQASTETQLCIKLVDWVQTIARLMFPAIALRHSEQRRANARNGSLVKFLPPVVISPLSTHLIPNFRVSLPYRHDTPLSLKTKPFIRVLHWGTLQNASPFLDSVLLVAHFWISHLSMTLIISWGNQTLILFLE